MTGPSKRDPAVDALVAALTELARNEPQDLAYVAAIDRLASPTAVSGRLLAAITDPALGEHALVRLGDVLVPLYLVCPMEVARLCDEVLDRSGKLLGEIRRSAREHREGRLP